MKKILKAEQDALNSAIDAFAIVKVVCKRMCGESGMFLVKMYHGI